MIIKKELESLQLIGRRCSVCFMAERSSYQAQSSFSVSFVSSRLLESLSACFIRSCPCEWKHKFLRKRKNSQPGIHLVFISCTQSNSIQSKSKSLKAPIYQFAVEDRVPHSQALPRFWSMIWIPLSHTHRYSHTLYSPYTETTCKTHTRKMHTCQP